MKFNFNKSIDQPLPGLEKLIKKSIYMQPVPVKDVNVLLNIRDEIPVKKDRLLSFIKNSVLWLEFLQWQKWKDQKMFKEADQFWAQPLTDILTQAGE